CTARRRPPAATDMSAWTLHVGRDGLATLVLDVPERRVNVLSYAILEELEKVVEELATRQDVACLVLLSGKDSTFIAGADVEQIATVEDPAVAEMVSRKGQAI